MSSGEAQKLYQKLDREAAAAGYLLNGDRELVMDLMDGLVTNRERYGYLSCPCRLADGVREKDLDIICPCDYRDADLDEYGACYCALYVSAELAASGRAAGPVPERRPAEQPAEKKQPPALSKGGLAVWRCKVCGYLCARPAPPLKCPICKADQDRFERFELA